MSRITPVNQIVGTESNQSLLNRIFGLNTLVNGGLDFGESTQTNPADYTGNMSGIWANVQAPASPNTEFAVPHFLGTVPSAYIYNTDVAAIVYQLPNTGTPWTDMNIYVKCTVANANIRIFIM